MGVIMYKGKNSDEAAARRSSCLFDFLAVVQCSPIRGVFAGAGEIWGCCPPTRCCSQEDKLRIRAQLRLGSGNRRKTNTEKPNSVEKGAHRRKAPAPVRVCFAGASARANLSPPTSLRSPEDSM